MIPLQDWKFDIQEELERKMIEALEALQNAFRRGDMTRHAYNRSLYALNMATRGLVSEDISFAIDDEIKATEGEEVEKIVSIKNGSVYVFSRVSGDDKAGIGIVSFKEGVASLRRETKSFEEETDGVAMCKDWFDQLPLALQRQKHQII